MAGTLTATTIQNDTSSPPTFRNNSVEIGRLCRAWVNYNGTTQTIAGSFNVSSVTYNSAGNYRVNFTTALPSANASVSIAPQTDNVTYTRVGSLNGSSPIATTYVDVLFYEYNNRSIGNVHTACISVFS